jgi:hypothetical protein
VYHDSCFACCGAVNQLPCCPGDPAVSTEVGGECQIVIAETVTDRPVIYVRGFMRDCKGHLTRTVLGLPRALDRKVDL